MPRLVWGHTLQEYVVPQPDYFHYTELGRHCMHLCCRGPLQPNVAGHKDSKKLT